MSSTACQLENDIMQSWNRFLMQTLTDIISPPSPTAAVHSQSHLPSHSMKWVALCCNKSFWCPANKSISLIQYLFEQFHPSYLVFAQQYFGGERWGADIIRSGVRRDRYQCSNFAVLCENHEYVIAELCTDDLCWNSIDFSLCLSRSDNGLRSRHFVNPEKEEETGKDT